MACGWGPPGPQEAFVAGRVLLRHEGRALADRVALQTLGTQAGQRTLAALHTCGLHPHVLTAGREVQEPEPLSGAVGGAVTLVACPFPTDPTLTLAHLPHSQDILSKEKLKAEVALLRQEENQRNDVFFEETAWPS